MSGRPAPPEHTPPGEGVVQIRDSATPPLQPSTGSTGGASVSLGKRGCPRFSRRPSRSSPTAAAGGRAALSWASLSCQHSVNTQYRTKAINSHFKETETQFSHQSQEQQLAGLRNVTAQLAAPPPTTWPHLQGDPNSGLCQAAPPLPPNQVTLPGGGVGVWH